MNSDDSAYRLWRGESPAPSIQSLGGKARAASMTPEERTKAARHAATKGARKLGKEGRRLRALKGAATRKARAEAAQRWGSTPAVEREIDALANTMRKGDALQGIYVDALGRARDASGAIVGRQISLGGIAT